MLSINRCSGPSDPRYGVLTFRVFWRRLSVLKFETAQSRPISRNRFSTVRPSPKGRLLQRHAEQHLHRQAGLDGCVTVVGLSATLSGRCSVPRHGGIEPDRQRAAALERFVIGGPVPGLVGGGCRSAHAAQLPRWIHEMNPSWDLCNRARSAFKALKRRSHTPAIAQRRKRACAPVHLPSTGGRSRQGSAVRASQSL